MSLRVEDLLTKLQNQLVPTVDKTGDVKTEESGFIVLVVIAKNDFARSFLNPFNLIALLFSKARMPNSASVFQDGTNVGLKDGQHILNWSSIFS